MYSRIHEHHAHVVAAEQRGPATRRDARQPHPPPGRLRAEAAGLLVSVARRLDDERARRALA